MNNPQVVNLSPDTAASPASGAGDANTRRRAAAPLCEHTAFVPVLLCALTLLAWFTYQAVVLLGDRDALQTARASQQQTVDNAAKLRASLDALAADTQRLANAGNPNASLLVAELRKRNITISVPAAGAVPAEPAASR